MDITSNMGDPKIILLFSGKRKSGKDYICEKLKQLLTDGKCCIIRISGPLKQLYAKDHNLDFNELMRDTPYKENYRLDMINWSDKVRRTDPGYFCRAACENAPLKPVWIISDIRRKTDIVWFKNTYQEKIKTVRIVADETTRKNRGWVFTDGVDNVTSECDLDDYNNWDLLINNNSDEDVEAGIQQIITIINSN